MFLWQNEAVHLHLCFPVSHANYSRCEYYAIADNCSFLGWFCVWVVVPDNVRSGAHQRVLCAHHEDLSHSRYIKIWIDFNVPLNSCSQFCVGVLKKFIEIWEHWTHPRDTKWGVYRLHFEHVGDNCLHAHVANNDRKLVQKRVLKRLAGNGYHVVETAELEGREVVRLERVQPVEEPLLISHFEGQIFDL